MEIYLGLVGIVLVGFGSLWYRVGKLTSETQEHNKRLDKIDKKLETLLNGR